MERDDTSYSKLFLLNLIVFVFSARTLRKSQGLFSLPVSHVNPVNSTKIKNYQDIV